MWTHSESYPRFVGDFRPVLRIADPIRPLSRDGPKCPRSTMAVRKLPFPCRTEHVRRIRRPGKDRTGNPSPPREGARGRAGRALARTHDVPVAGRWFAGAVGDGYHAVAAHGHGDGA